MMSSIYPSIRDTNLFRQFDHSAEPKKSRFEPHQMHASFGLLCIQLTPPSILMLTIDSTVGIRVPFGPLFPNIIRPPQFARLTVQSLALIKFRTLLATDTNMYPTRTSKRRQRRSLPQLDCIPGLSVSLLRRPRVTCCVPNSSRTYQRRIHQQCSGRHLAQALDTLNNHDFDVRMPAIPSDI